MSYFRLLSKTVYGSPITCAISLCVSRFNLPHDDDNRCRRPYISRDPEARDHIMSPTIDAQTDPWSWSKCSSRELGKFLE